jgi:cytochrome b6-f complex iron-sulfur subunit
MTDEPQKPADATGSTPAPAAPAPGTPAAAQSRVIPAAKQVAAPIRSAAYQASAAPPAGGGAAPASPPAPAAATAAPGGKAGAAVSRRGFLSTVGVAWSAFAAACAAGAIATNRFMFPNVLFEPPQTFKAGVPSEFLPGTVDGRFKESFGVFVAREEEGTIYALRAVCTHLGCTPNWLEAENKFKCPCHGSGFYRTGINFEGPAPRPLERYRIVLADDGQILIDKTKIFAYEKGEWGNPEAMLVA